MKLEAELNLEREMKEYDAVPENVQAYLDNSEFKVRALNPRLRLHR